MKSCKKYNFSQYFLIFTTFNRQLVSFGTVREIWVFTVQKFNNYFSFQVWLEIFKWDTLTLPKLLPFQNLQPSLKIEGVIEFLDATYLKGQNQFPDTKVLLSENIMNTSGHIKYFLKPNDLYTNTDITFTY